MSSPITFSGFNNIDFSSVLEALAAQERIPVTQLESQQAALKQQRTALGSLATKLGAIESASRDNIGRGGRTESRVAHVPVARAQGVSRSGSDLC